MLACRGEARGRHLGQQPGRRGGRGKGGGLTPTTRRGVVGSRGERDALVRWARLLALLLGVGAARCLRECARWGSSRSPRPEGRRGRRNHRARAAALSHARAVAATGRDGLRGALLSQRAPRLQEAHVLREWRFRRPLRGACAGVVGHASFCLARPLAERQDGRRGADSDGGGAAGGDAAAWGDGGAHGGEDVQGGACAPVSGSRAAPSKSVTLSSRSPCRIVAALGQRCLLSARRGRAPRPSCLRRPRPSLTHRSTQHLVSHRSTRSIAERRKCSGWPQSPRRYPICASALAC